MREILFRAKAINRDNGYHRTNYKNGDWVYGLISRPYKEMFPTLPMEFRNENGVDGIEVDYKSVGQFTGLTDKNGKKIFEGDIVRYTRKCMYEPTCSFHKKDLVSLHLICWNDEEYAFEQNHYSLESQRVIGRGNIMFTDDRAKENIIVVIGNIHDNPELFEVQNG